MATYVTIDITADPEEMIVQMHEQLRTRIPAFEGADSNLETWLMDIWARLLAEVLSLAMTMPDEALMKFGETVISIPSLPASEAVGDSTWTMKDNAGYTIPEGTTVVIPKSGSENVGFVVAEEVVVPPGSTATAAGEVPLRAIEPGDEANDLTEDPVPNQALEYVTLVELTGATAGGVDAEDPADYRNRLVEELQLMTPTPILPRDFEVLAQRIVGVQRATALSGWDPSGDTLGNERYVGIVAIDEDGADISAGLKTELTDYLESLREVNFVVEVGAPTYTAIDVTTTVRCHETFDAATVDAAVTEALEAYLDPASWGIPPFGDATGWINTDEVRIGEVYQVINAVPGVNYVEALTVEGAGVDVVLTGRVPLTTPGAIAVTANPGP
jgi:uncharacterized phage protein gp47/JayE